MYDQVVRLNMYFFCCYVMLKTNDCGCFYLWLDRLQHTQNIFIRRVYVSNNKKISLFLCATILFSFLSYELITYYAIDRSLCCLVVADFFFFIFYLTFNKDFSSLWSRSIRSLYCFYFYLEFFLMQFALLLFFYMYHL